MPTNIRTINIYPAHGTTLIFNANTYSKEIEPEPPPHSSDKTLVYSNLDNTSSEPAIHTLESTPPNKPINIRAQINSGANRSITSNINILHVYKDIKPFHIGSINKGGTMPCTCVGITICIPVLPLILLNCYTHNQHQKILYHLLKLLYQIKSLTSENGFKYKTLNMVQEKLS